MPVAKVRDADEGSAEKRKDYQPMKRRVTHPLRETNSAKGWATQDAASAERAATHLPLINFSEARGKTTRLYFSTQPPPPRPSPLFASDPASRPICTSPQVFR